MRRTVVRILVLIVACLGGACTSVLAQEHSIKMSFLDNVGSDFALLLMGSEEGEVSLGWEDGSVESMPCIPRPLPSEGKRSLKIWNSTVILPYWSARVMA